MAAGGERGRARAAEFTWERTAAMTREVYNELL
jgi:glycosyltransferase involved in cell wall biosynthesis